MELVATTRNITGKKVRFLRRQGVTPVNLFGHSIEPMSLQCDTLQLKNTLARTGTTGLVTLKVNKEKEPRTVMFREVQRDPLTAEVLHVDIYQVRMEEEIRVEVPVITVGEAPALKLKENMLEHELNNLTIECLPAKIPSHIEVDLSPLAEAGDAIHVSDLNLGEGINILTNPEQVIAKISVRFVEKEVPAEAVAEVEAGAEAEATEEAEEGGSAGEGR